MASTLTPPLEQGSAIEQLELRSRIRREFLELPGLVLTQPQAVRLFGLESECCNAILSDLVSTGFLDTDGRWFLRAHQPPHSHEVCDVTRSTHG